MDDKNTSHKNINLGRIISSKYQNSSTYKRLMKGSKEDVIKPHTCRPKKSAHFQAMITRMSKKTFKRQILRSFHRNTNIPEEESS